MTPDAHPSQWEMTREVIRRAGLASSRTIGLLSGYFLLTPLNAATDGVAWLLLVDVFSARAGMGGFGPLDGAGDYLHWIPSRFMMDSGSKLSFICALFALKAAMTVAIWTLEGTFQASVRRRLQEHCLSMVMGGRWETLRHGSVGQWLGAATEESTIFAGYLTMGIRTLYALITFVLLASMALLVDPKLCLFMMLVLLPAALLLRHLYQRHAVMSGRLAAARQGFAADATERLTGLFQIKAFGELAPHLDAAISGQADYMHAETRLALLTGVINAFSPMILPILLVAFSLWTAWHGHDLAARISVLGSVGILGYRAASNLTTLIGSFGNLTSYAGCVRPVHRLCLTPQDAVRPFLPEPLTRIELAGVGYAFDGKPVMLEKSLTIEGGRIFLVTGKSGGGKTTLANLIAGLYEPASGRIAYVGASGRSYDAREYRAKIGYVTQDVFLFRGTIRRNLDPWGKIGDADLWRRLEQAGAKEFVQTLGGLDVEVSESGRSLSGGERRRLAIAATLAQRADALILDEVTNGLDDAAKKALVETMAALSREVLVIAISHDLAAFEKVETTAHAVLR